MYAKRESKQELEIEASIAKVIGLRFGCNMVKAPITYSFDFFAFRKQKLVSVIEIKTSTKYTIAGLKNGFSICALKLATCLGIADVFGVPFFVFLKEPTGIYYLRVTRALLEALDVEFITTSVLVGLSSDGSYEPFDVVYKFKQELWTKVKQ